MRSEAALEAVCRLRAKDRGGLLVKLHHSIVGLPDRVLFMPGGRVTFIEFKAPKGRLKMVQLHWLNELNRMGFRAVVVRDVAFFDVLTGAT